MTALFRCGAPRHASIALAHDATVLTRNLQDFAQVPGLKIENWLD